MVRRGGLRRFLDRLDLSGGAPDEERLGVDGERNLALRGGVVTTRDLQRSLDALGLYHYLEARGAAAHPNRDPYHLPTCLLFRTAAPTSVRAAFASTTRHCKPSLLQPHNRCINNRRQSFQRPRGQCGQSSSVRARVGPVTPTSLWDYSDSATVEERRAYLAAAFPRVHDLPADPNIL